MDFCQNSPYEYTDFGVIGKTSLMQIYATKDILFFKGLIEICPYWIHFHQNLKDFSTVDFCEHLFWGYEFCESRCSKSLAFLMGVKEFWIPTFHFAFTIIVLCHITINWRKWGRGRNASYLSFLHPKSWKTVRCR
jgi:hypothetical protein